MRILRLASVGALVLLVAAPVPRVYTSGEPKIGRFVILAGDLKEVWGTGLPGSRVYVDYRQRGFREDESNFSFCTWNNGGNWLGAGPIVTVGSDGLWSVTGLDVMVYPTVIGQQRCDAAAYTEFRVAVAGQPQPPLTPPELLMMNVRSPDGSDRWVEARVRSADQVALGVADGPDMPGTQHPGEPDADEDGIDLCNTRGLGCGADVTWRKDSGYTFFAPKIIEDDGSVFGIPNIVDAEFDFVTGMVQAHRPSYSFLAVATLPRWRAAKGPTLQVNVDVNFDFQASCGNSFFDFLKL